MERLRSIARRHPRLFSGAWFAAAALLLASPLGAAALLFLALEMLAGRPVGAYLSMLLASVALPLLSAFATGALAGPRILRLPPGRPGRAAAWGAAAAAGALLLWVLLIEGVPRVLMGATPTSGSGGDVPGAAIVVGYLVVLPLIVVLCVAMGAVAGVLLQLLATRRTAEPEA